MRAKAPTWYVSIVARVVKTLRLIYFPVRKFLGIDPYNGHMGLEYLPDTGRRGDSRAFASLAASLEYGMFYMTNFGLVALTLADVFGRVTKA